ncbi:MAG: hypothetical protein IIA02_11975 [Proteobacteria bacterium]|uniref:hypothetical protein n=1 Tax=Aquabacterium sp. TaxID=1872578 RepID=UPI0035C734DB|nr:hypothetical protein [Pseudomonadota bacterium]
MKKLSGVIAASLVFCANVDASTFSTLDAAYLSGDSAMEDTVVISLVNMCQSPKDSGGNYYQTPASARVFTFTPDALPVDLGAKGGVFPLGGWKAEASEFYKSTYSHKFVVACSDRRFGPYSVVSVNLVDGIYRFNGGGVIDFLTATYAGVDGSVSRAPDDYFSSIVPADEFVDPHARSAARSSVQVLFGVAVSLDLYKALQKAQGIVVPDGEDDRLSKYQPSISKAQYTSIVSDAFNSMKNDAAGALGVPVGKLMVCKFADKFGVQAASDEYFLHIYSGGDGVAGGAIAAADANNYGIDSGLQSYQVSEGVRALDVRRCLSSPGYAMGVLPLENLADRDPKYAKISADRNFRFVRLGGVSPLDFAFVSTPPNGRVLYKMTHPGLKGGVYDFVYSAGYKYMRADYYGFVDAGWFAATFGYSGQATPPAGTASVFDYGFDRNSFTAPLASWQ